MEKIDITRELLVKDEHDMTKEERDAVHKYNQMVEKRYEDLDRVNNYILKDCKMLCSGNESYPVPTYGWIYPVEKLCYELEAMNYEYKKYGLKVTLEQTKEKFGTLRFYTDTSMRPIGLIGFLAKPFYFISDKLSKINYGINYVTDEAGYYTFDLREIPEENYNKNLNINGYEVKNNIVKITSRSEIPERSGLASDTYFLNEDGKYYVSVAVWHTPKRHPVCTKNRLLRLVYIFSNRVISILNSYYVESDIQGVMKKVFDDKIYDLIRIAENECNKRCYSCGTLFNDEYSPACRMHSWILYLCENCAKITGNKYTKLSETKKDGEA